MKLRGLLIALCLLCPISGLAQVQKLPELTKTTSPLLLPESAKFKQAVSGLLPDITTKQSKKAAVLENNDIEAHSLAPGVKSNTRPTNQPNNNQTLTDDPNAVSDEYLRKEGIYLPNTRSTPGRSIRTKRK
ncbi:MAG: hypothetical protein J0M03_23205 [Acidobacteria bacterium]|nr:hypothetical protein [Acidobacteriota bacterium]